MTRQSSERPAIGYYGAIADWFDSDLVAALADRDAGVVERRRAFARRETWDERVRLLDDLLPSHV